MALVLKEEKATTLFFLILVQDASDSFKTRNLNRLLFLEGVREICNRKKKKKKAKSQKIGSTECAHVYSIF